MLKGMGNKVIEDHHKILEIDRDTSPEDVKKVYSTTVSQKYLKLECFYLI